MDLSNSQSVPVLQTEISTTILQTRTHVSKSKQLINEITQSSDKYAEALELILFMNIHVYNTHFSHREIQYKTSKAVSVVPT